MVCMKQFLDNLPLGLFKCGNDGSILIKNKKFLDIIECTSTKTAPPKNLKTCFNDERAWHTFIQLIQQNRFVEQHQVVMKSMKGNVLVVRINANVEMDQENQILSFYGSLEDITELNDMNRRLKQEQYLLNAFMENIPDHVYFKNRESRFIRINTSLAKWFGLKNPVLAIGKSDFDFFSKEHAQAAYDDEQRIIKTGNAISKEEKETWPDGHISWVITNKMPIKDKYGQIIGTFGVSRDVTVQRESEYKLKEQMSLMNALMDNIPDSIFFKDDKGRYIACNQAMALSLGISNKDDLIGAMDSDFFDKKYVNLFFEEEKRLLETGEPVVGKIHQVRQKASDRHVDSWYSTTKVPIRDRFDNITGLVGISRDITAFKNAEENFLASEEKYQTVFESSNDAVLLLGQNRIFDCNETMIKIFGMKNKRDILNMHPGDLSPQFQPDGMLSTEAADLKIEEAYAKGTLHFEWIHKRMDQSEFPAEVTLTAFPMKKEKVILAIVRDITNRKNAEKAIQRYFDVFKNMEIGLYVCQSEDLNDEKSLRIVEANPSTEKILGIPCSESIGRKIVEVFPNLYEKQIPQLLATVIRKQKPVEIGEFYYGDSRVAKAWFNAHAFPLPERCVGISFENISDRKSMEGQLQLGQKLESIGQLAAGIAHEINTPTQYVGDNTRFLKDAFQELDQVFEAYGKLLSLAKEREECREIIGEIVEQIESADLDYLLEEIPSAIEQSLEGVERVTKIVRAMKDFSHPGSTDQTNVDINKTIETTITVSRNEWKYDAEMKMDFDPTLPMINCYVDEFNQVILNLITNAAHSIADANQKLNRSQGEICVTTKKSPDQAFVQVGIKDNGLGIPKQNYNKIFDPFFTTKEVGKGTGQGLAIAHNIIVKKHKGKLSFSSEEGKGTEFVIELPL